MKRLDEQNPANKHEKAFWAFHRANPHVYAMFDRFTRQAISRGRKRLSAYLVVERIRWETTMETQGDDYKINNNHRPYYARLWSQNNPTHADLFVTRELTTEPLRGSDGQGDLPHVH